MLFPVGSVQPLDQKSGMVNIRADDDQEPEDVLAQLSLEQRVRLGCNCVVSCMGLKAAELERAGEGRAGTVFSFLAQRGCGHRSVAAIVCLTWRHLAQVCHLLCSALPLMRAGAAGGDAGGRLAVRQDGRIHRAQRELLGLVWSRLGLQLPHLCMGAGGCREAVLRPC